MLRYTLILSFFFFTISTFAQDIPQDRLSDWSLCGLTQSIDNSSVEIDPVTDLGLSSDSSANDNSSRLNDAIEAITQPTTFTFPSGIFLFLDPIVLKSNTTIKGNGRSTQFIFDEIGESDCIQLHGTTSKDPVAVNQSVKGKNYLILTNGGLFSPDKIILIADTDSNKIFSSWALHSTGQVGKVKNQTGDTLFLHNKLRREYLAENDPHFFVTEPITNASVENISILRLDSSASNTSNIGLNYAYNCLIKCVSSELCDFAHISSSRGLHNSIIGNYLTKSADYGGGGSGYGIVLQFTNSECLVSDNTFSQLRHSILIQSGANGNVIAYNYSRDPFWEGTSLPSDAAGDLVLHGNYPYANLCEGNVVQNIVIDESHGINGPNNIIFRNRAKGYGIVMNSSIPSDSQLFIGNEVTNTSFFKGLYLLAGDGHYEFGNNIKGTARPNGTASLQVSSLYLDNAPPNEDALTWPSVGYPNSIEKYTNNAELRFSRQRFTLCDTAITNYILPLDTETLTIYPNPSSGLISMLQNNRFTHYQLLDSKGIEISNGILKYQMDFSSLSSGVYYLTLSDRETRIVKKLIITY
ncbi:MAG: hypothetical protein ACI80H_001173 [Pseudoalteromonas distincta]|jgi:hypothetical protein